MFLLSIMLLPFGTMQIYFKLRRVTIKDVPAGSYKIQACHELLGNLEKGIDVQAIKPVQVNFSILPNE